MLASIVVSVVTVMAGVPGPMRGVMAGGAACATFFTGTFVPGTRYRRVKNALLWGAHFGYFAGAGLIMNRWFGA